MITGKTRLLAILGDPIDKTRSPEGFTRVLAQNGYDAVMLPIECSSADLPRVGAGLKAMRNLDGLLFTMPHKTAALELADEVLETGRLVRAVNALRRRPDGRWEADMFDGRGFVGGLEAHGQTARGRRVALLGAGGAGSAIAVALAQAGAASIAIHDVDAARAERLAGIVAGRFAAVACRVAPPDLAAADLLINATPLGMHADDPLPWRLDGLRPGTIVADVTTKPEITPFLAAARRRDAPILTGRDMYEGQVRAIGEFLGYPFKTV